MEARLLEDLRHKLDQLENKMQAYRRDRVADFQHHYLDLVRDVPPNTASNVQRAITGAFANCPMLRPELPAADSHPPESPRPAAFQPFQPFPPFPPPAVSETPDETPRNPRERDYDLEGLFTPTYLPLLDSSPIPLRSSLTDAFGTVSPIPHFALLPERATQGTGKPQTMRMEGTREQGGEQDHAPDRSLPPAQPLSASVFPNDSPRLADDARSSVSSDKSDSKPARSALRRTSSMSKHPQSPRRVRFEFMGAEVLPTTSPQPSQSMTRRPSSPGPGDGDDDDATFDSNLGGDTAEEERAPPRKVSSSDALRALSRTPLEEGAIWTVVNPDADEVALDELDPVAATPPPAAAVMSRATLESSKVTQRGSPVVNSEKMREEDKDDDDSSDDEFLAMAKTRSSRKSSLSTASAPLVANKPAHDGATTTSSKNKQASDSRTTEEETSPKVVDNDGNDGEAERDEEVFYFEDGGLSAPPRPRPRPTANEDEDSQESESKDDEPSALPTDTLENQMGIYATSPAIPIRKSWRSRPSTAPNVRFQPGSLGSYKGRPLMMPIVRDPEVLAQANSVRASDMRVDGVDDETAMEDGSPPRFPSTPLSFKERFMMEDMMESATGKKDEDKEASR